MTKLRSIFVTILFVSAITACNKNSNHKKEEGNSPNQTAVTVQKSSDKATCSTQETTQDGTSTLTKTCFYKNYKSISDGQADYKGRYSYKYTLFVKNANQEFVQIKNAELFNNPQELLSRINAQIEKEYLSYANDPQTQDCFDGATFSPFNFEQLGVDFDESNINFHVSFGLSEACMSVDGTIVSFSLDDIQKYLK